MYNELIIIIIQVPIMYSIQIFYALKCVDDWLGSEVYVCLYKMFDLNETAAEEWSVAYWLLHSLPTPFGFTVTDRTLIKFP